MGAYNSSDRNYPSDIDDQYYIVMNEYKQDQMMKNMNARSIQRAWRTYRIKKGAKKIQQWYQRWSINNKSACTIQRWFNKYISKKALNLLKDNKRIIRRFLLRPKIYQRTSDYYCCWDYSALRNDLKILHTIYT